MITKRQAHKMRGKLIHLLTLAEDYAHAGAEPPEIAQYIREDYNLAKRDFLDLILELTEDVK